MQREGESHSNPLLGTQQPFLSTFIPGQQCQLRALFPIPPMSNYTQMLLHFVCVDNSRGNCCCVILIFVLFILVCSCKIGIFRLLMPSRWLSQWGMWHGQQDCWAAGVQLSLQAVAECYLIMCTSGLKVLEGSRLICYWLWNPRASRSRSQHWDSSLQ